MNKAGAQKEESTQLGLALMNADYRSQGYTNQISDLHFDRTCIPGQSHFSHGLNRLEFYYNDMKVGNILSEATSEVSF